MEFLDEDSKPRFVFQSGAVASTEPQPNHKPTKPFLFVTVSLSSLLVALSLFFLQSEPFKSLLLWLSLSLFLGPFAPPSITGGDVRVGRGHVVDFPDPEPEPDDHADKRPSQRRSKPRRSEDVGVVGPLIPTGNGGASEKRRGDVGIENRVAVVEEEKEWKEEDVEVLKKQMAKHPVGKPGRWEAIAAAFGGRHGVDSVIKKVKELGEKRVDDSESYALFLKKRKALDKRVVENGGEDIGGGSSATLEKVENGWSSGEDIALLNALKAFPKDVSMRWEKVAAAVPGKSKAACMKRFAELKKGFRSSKAAADG